MVTESKQPSLGIIGRGRAARSLASALKHAGWTATWWWDVGDEGRIEELPPAEVILLAVSDDAIEEVAGRLSARASAGSEVWLHLSGSRPGHVARATPELPRAAGCMHPVQSLDGSAIGPQHLSGVTAGLDGDPEAVAVAATMAGDLGMIPRELRPGSKVLYHAAAVTTAGHVVAAFEQAIRMLQGCGFSRQDAQATLYPLLRGAVDNLGHGSPAEVITGPTSRGDVGTVKAHLEQLDELDPGLAATYRALARTALEMAELREEQRAELEKVLEGGSQG